MRKVLFVCTAGMSTSLLVTKTQKAARDRGVDLEIAAFAEMDVRMHLEGVSVVLLGPQVRYMLPKMEKTLEGTGIKTGLIDTIDYGRMNGEAVLDQILEMLGE